MESGVGVDQVEESVLVDVFQFVGGEVVEGVQ